MKLKSLRRERSMRVEEKIFYIAFFWFLYYRYKKIVSSLSVCVQFQRVGYGTAIEWVR
jgi:hypothetical protein